MRSFFSKTCLIFFVASYVGSGNAMLRAPQLLNAVTQSFFKALRMGEPGLARSLIRHKDFYPDRVDDEGATPLFKAGSMRYAGITSLLLDCGADPNKASKHPLRYPLHAAIFPHVDCYETHKRSNSILIGVLVAHGANVNATDRFGRTPLIHATDPVVNRALIRYLIAHGADPSAVICKRVNEIVKIVEDGDYDQERFAQDPWYAKIVKDMENTGGFDR